MTKRIAILMHERDRPERLHRYTIGWFADVWREQGLDVVPVLGADRFVPADVAVVHVDLSVVPDEYLDLARRYPVAVNARVRDIRKSSYSQLGVTRDSAYGGRVIVKSDQNAAGIPERVLASRTLWGRWHSRAQRVLGRQFRSPADYRIYERIDDVPAHCFRGNYFFVERFLPEVENGTYYMRMVQFLGDRFDCVRRAANDPIVSSGSKVGLEIIDARPELFELRSELGLEYGKIDYVEHDGEVFVLDANKTPGTGVNPMSSDALARRRSRAEGIYSFLR